MFLEKILLRNFRNLKDIVLKAAPSLNIFIGPNGQGKTNFLESIYLLGTAESHRTNKEREMIHWDREKALVQGLLHKEEQQIKLSLLLDRTDKIVKVNDNQLSTISEFLGIFNTVIFSPGDLQLVKGSPARRRKFINLEISQVSNLYYNLLKKYEHVLRQRNNLLKDIRDRGRNKDIETLEIWDIQLVELGSKIIEKRVEVLGKLNILARLKQREITTGRENLSVEYESSLGELKSEDIKLIFKQNLVNNRDNEIKRGYTLVGPHRDDIILKINEIDLRKYGSQGQQRTSALALKLAELEFMKSETGEYPVLLLDDVFSELDENRRQTLIESITGKIQTFITTTEINTIGEINNGSRKIFRVDNGQITEGW